MIERDAAKGVIQMASTKGKDTDAQVADEPAAEETFSAKDLAQTCGVDAKAFRRWLRSTTDQRANKGGRWVFNKAERQAILDKWAERNAKPAAEANTES